MPQAWETIWGAVQARPSTQATYGIDLFAKSSKESDAVPPSNEIIVKDPEILGGIAVFRGTRVPFKNLLDYLEGGHTLDEFLEQFPSVTRETAIAALEHAKELVIAQVR